MKKNSFLFVITFICFGRSFSMPAKKSVPLFLLTGQGLARKNKARERRFGDGARGGCSNKRFFAIPHDDHQRRTRAAQFWNCAAAAERGAVRPVSDILLRHKTLDSKLINIGWCIETRRLKLSAMGPWREVEVPRPPELRWLHPSHTLKPWFSSYKITFFNFEIWMNYARICMGKPCFSHVLHRGLEPTPCQRFAFRAGDPCAKRTATTHGSVSILLSN